jgi:hypothetical protein
MARQLQLSDGSVRSLVLLDMPPWSTSFSLPTTADNPEPEYDPTDPEILAQLFFGVTRGNEKSFLGPGTDEEQIVRLITRTQMFSGFGEREIAWAKRLVALAREHQAAARKYRPSMYPGKIVLFQPTENLRERVYTDYDELTTLSTEPVEICPIAGSHATLLSRHGIAAISNWYARRF